MTAASAIRVCRASTSIPVVDTSEFPRNPYVRLIVDRRLRRKVAVADRFIQSSGQKRHITETVYDRVVICPAMACLRALRIDVFDMVRSGISTTSSWFMRL